MGQFIDNLIDECTAAGVVFHPKAGQLRPELTRGRPPESLLEKVKANREKILIRLVEMMDFKRDNENTKEPHETDSK